MEEEKSKELCCLCGSRIANTRDHVFPKCLFNTPRPTNLPTIPVCKECNHYLSKDEEVFRYVLAAGMVFESDAGYRIYMDKIRPDLHGRRKGLKPLIQAMVRKAKVISQSGDVIGYIPILEVDRGRFNRVMHKIAKGLYYFDTHQVFPQDVDIFIGYYQENQGILAPPLDETMKSAKRIELGNGEVIYWRNIVKDNPEESLTWIKFYNDKLFLICTSRQDFSES